MPKNLARVYTKAVMAKKEVEKQTKLAKWLPWLLVIGSTIAIICAMVITYEKLQLAEDPNHTQICDINPIISCGSVMTSEQATAFWDIPNPFLGMIGFPIVATLGVVLLAGVALRRWLWQGLQAGLLFAVGFCHWLFYQAVYEINALCIWCMTVWAVTIAMFWYTLLQNLRTGAVPTPKGWEKFVAFLQRHHLDILVAWYLLIIGLILHHFWYYFSTLV